MSLLQAIILGLVQGLTEFIPVSSSGHLLLIHHLLGIESGGLSFDVALHIGTLAALLLFFHKDILKLLREGKRGGPQRRLAILLAIATVPAVLAGLWLEDAAQTSFRSPVLVCVSLGLMALVMLLAESVAIHRPVRSIEKISFKQGLLVGCAQAVAVIPGVSRSGSTITAGLFVGLDRVAATRFSFLMSIPITFGAIGAVLLEDQTLSQIKAEPDLFAIGILTAFASGALAIRFLLRFVAKHTLRPFAYYRLAVAIIGLILLTTV